MPKSISKLKDQARLHEQNQEWEKAAHLYQQVLRAAEEEGDVAPELGLYNRVGDLYLRLGRPQEAVAFFERAADQYAADGGFNSAIALCNKALRHVPNRLELYRKLGRLSASQGFLSDARRWFLEFAERSLKHGALEEAFSALGELADLTDDPEVRELLARQLHTHGHTVEAVDEMRRAYARRVRAGDREAAETLRAEVRAIDPEAAESLDVDLQEAPAAAGPLAGLPLLQEPEAESPAAGEHEVVARGAAGLEAAGAGQPGDAARPEGFDPTALADAGALDSTPAALALELTEEVLPEDVTPLPLLEVEPPGEAAADEAEAQPELPLIDLQPPGEGLPAEYPEPPAPLPMLELRPPAEPPAPAEEASPVTLPLLGMQARGEAGAPAEAESPPAVPPLGAQEAAAGLGDSSAGASLPELDRRERQGPPASQEAPPAEPDDPVVALARSLYAHGQRAAGRAALGQLLADAEHSGNATRVLEVLDTIAELEPDDVAVHRRRVERYFSASGPRSAVAALLALADALERAGLGARASAVYQQVLDIDPSNAAAGAALLAEREARPRPQDGGGFVNLGALLLEEAEPTEDAARLVAPSAEPTGGEEADFVEMLEQFKVKAAEHMGEDPSAHYDLGLAYKEMGLLDEAVAEFQIALRNGQDRLKVLEELGRCFMLKDQPRVALRLLGQALAVPGRTELDYMGVNYMLGRCYEAIGEYDAARDAYERVVGLDIQFNDVAERLARL